MTGILIAAIIIGLIVLVGGFALFLLLPVLIAIVGTLALVVVMAVVAILMVPNFITLDGFKPDIINMLKQATGREIAIGGPIGFTVWPVLGLQLRDISIGNPKGADDPIMLSAQELGVGVTLSSLMDHRLELRELRLVGGQLNLMTDSRGRGNWNFKPTDGEATSTDSLESATATSDETTPASASPDEQFSIKDIQIEKIEVVRTNISYDSAEGEPVDLDNINLAISMPSLDKPLNVTGSVSLRETEVKIAGTVDKPRAVMDNKETPVNFTLSLGGDQVKLDGNLQGTAFKGNLTAAVANLTKLASWAGGAATPVPFSTLNISTVVDANATRANLTDLAIKLDDMTVGGKLSANWSGARPRLTADVDVSAINLDKLMPPAAAAPAGNTSASTAAPDLSVLDKFNADITARLAGLTVKGAQLGSTTATVTINNGRMQSAITPAALYDGTLAVKADVSAAGRGGRTFNANVDLKGVQIGPVLVQFAGSDRLSGLGDLAMSISGPIANSDVMKRELNGNGSFIFRNGAIKGVNIPAMIRNAKGILSGQRAATESGPVQTDFTELTGSFTINNGVVSNNDLKMLSPLVRITGRGTASLPQSNVNYRVEAALVADLSGQGGVMERRGLIIPINVRGPFSALKYEPDLQGLVLGNIGAARDVGTAIESLGTKDGQRNMREGLKNMLGLPSRQPAPATTTTSPTEGAAPAEPAAAPPAPASPPPPPPRDVLRDLLTR